MKKIENRLIVTNILIVVTSLLAFFVLVTLNFTRYYNQNISEQLLKENSIAIRTINSQENQIGQTPFKLLANSSTLIFRESRGGFVLVNKGTQSLILNNTNIDDILEHEEGKVDAINFEGDKYYFTYSIEDYQFRQNQELETRVLVVSIISNQDYSFLNTTNVRLLIGTMFVLTLIAIIISIIFGKKITKPIVKLTKIAKEYSLRNFDQEIEVNSKDEIGDLAESMKEMATSLIEYEKGQTKFYRDLSHEIKTPLTSIYGYAEGINQDIFKDNDKPSRVIMDESLRIKEMLEDIILLNKLESKSEKFDFETGDISISIAKAIEKLEGVAILNDIEIEYLPSKVICVYDEEKIIRLMINLLSNALKYTSTKIVVKLKSHDDVFISVQDDGKGFSDESLRNIRSEITKVNTLGNGIGLLIAKEIVSRHNGSIICENYKDGAQVNVHLPFN
jgi:signal transduction histidine kinase